ncbi:hypothetical protein EII34_15020 [Arachnia propionica]|uniref:Uncharacterized protein n=1 Tax=Arachnia propionica TaxID=1750 RepID=A0A3P1T313_9ACTN|nr:hypothetical protein [Arachnia propionica]RRD03216.1 hypothetical protein EII34_15020 [Arachnia propionica]
MTQTLHLPDWPLTLTPAGRFRQRCARLIRAFDTRLDDLRSAFTALASRIAQVGQTPKEDQ